MRKHRFDNDAWKWCEENLRTLWIAWKRNFGSEIYTIYEPIYQYLNHLDLEEYDRITSDLDQDEFCEYQHKYHPCEVTYLECANIDEHEDRSTRYKLKHRL